VPVTHDDERAATRVATEAPGADEVAVVAWPLLLKRRVAERVESSDKYPWLVLATVLFGLFSVGFTITILSNSVRRIADDLGSDVSTLTWVLTGPLLAFAVFGPAAGKIADLKGQRRVYLASLGAVALFAGLTALAPSAGALILFRVLGAATGAATGPASLAIINKLFPPTRRAQAMGYWSMVAAGGPVVGVVAGGPIVQAFGWRWIFIAQVPLTLITLLLAAAILPAASAPTEEGEEPVGFDVMGAVTLGVGTTSLLLAVNRGPLWGWTHPAVIAGILLAPLMLVAFIAVERRAAHPLLPLGYLRRRNFSFPLLTQFCTNFAYMGGFVITPLLLQDEFGYSETKTGTLLIARPIVFAIAGPVAGYLTVRVGERTSAVFGAATITASMVALASLAPGDSDLFVVAALALSGLGMGASAPAMAAAIANAVDERDLGIAGATQQMVNQVGVVIGIQVMQTIQAARADTVGGVAAYGDAYMVGAAAALLGLAFAFFVKSTPQTVETEVVEVLPTGFPAVAGNPASARG
jgi:EmrB/QacA subfamily drug resistance transporter